MSVLDISRLGVGDRVQHELLVVERAEKKQASGDPFVVLTLRNATGEISTAPLWVDKLQWADGVEAGRVVQAVGDVAIYPKTGKRQLELKRPLRIVPTDDAKLEHFLPRIDGDVQRLWDAVDRLRRDVSSATLRRVLDLFFTDDAFRLQFEKTPGSTNGHHAKLGGLLLHVFEVTSMARQMARTMRANVDLVVTGALLHDVGKVEAYRIGPTGFTFTPCGLLLGHVVLGALMLERRVTAAGGAAVCSDGQLLELQHLILSHHGKLEWGSPVEPMTTEGEIVHRADEASAKATDMMDAIDDDEAFAGGDEFSDRRSWRVNRRVWRRPHGWE